jgi:hypothetical protein
MTPVHRGRRVLLSWIAIAAAVTAGLMWLLITIVDQADANQALQSQVNAEAAKVTALSEQVESLGEKPVVSPEGKPATVAAVTVEQVRAIVAEALVDRDLNLSPQQVDQIAAVAARQVPKPQPGKDGRTPTAAEVRAVVGQVVGQFCANDACKGEPGIDGQDGEPGPAPTDEQFDAALARYCSSQPGGTCEGESGRDGVDGKDGQDGEPGRGIAKHEFVRADDGSCVSRTTYTDGGVDQAPAGDAACPPAPLLR